MYWARALADQTSDRELSAIFTPIAQQLEQQERTIVSELNGVQGRPVEIGGYYHPDPRKTAAAMRPSATLNRIIESLEQESG
jgi:isocitrate dehydrogenase